MATLSKHCFDGKPQDAGKPDAAYEAPVIRTQMIAPSLRT